MHGHRKEKDFTTEMLCIHVTVTETKIWHMFEQIDTSLRTLNEGNCIANVALFFLKLDLKGGDDYRHSAHENCCDVKGGR